MDGAVEILSYWSKRFGIRTVQEELIWALVIAVLLVLIVPLCSTRLLLERHNMTI